MSLFEVLGQEVGIRTAVDAFYERVLADQELVPYFANSDTVSLRGHMTKLLMQVSGGPQSYSGRELAESHQPLNISPEHFERVAGHLADALDSLGVDAGVRDQVVGVIASHRDDVVSQPAAAAQS
jgi:hemoglobin